MPIDGPCGANHTLGAVGLARGPATFVPFWSKTRMSGVKGLVGEVVPPTTGLVSSLQLLGRPWPDSSTYTWKLFLLPLKAMPTGKFRSLAKTETLKPGGT